MSKLLQDKSGTIYGTTPSGGASGFGAVYQLSPPAQGVPSWTETIVFAFNDVDGSTPSGGLIQDGAGNLYGSTVYGGLSPTNRVGTVFRLVPPAAGQTQWTEQILCSFSETAADGANPVGGLTMDTEGNLFGATEYGGHGYGTVYEVSPPAPGQVAWTKAILFSFDGAASGAHPMDGLALGSHGALYGTTVGGGAGGLGTAFVLAPPQRSGDLWRYTLLHSFTGAPDGASPNAAVTVSRFGSIDGTTVGGGSTSCLLGCGTVFELSPPPSGQGSWSEKLYLPQSSSRGFYPDYSLAIGNDHSLLGDGDGPGGGVIARVPHRELQ